jgi:hypothetical protein
VTIQGSKEEKQTTNIFKAISTTTTATTTATTTITRENPTKRAEGDGRNPTMYQVTQSDEIA